ncbi:MAG TPA: PIN domain-containing protein [Candidatus Saccharimonadales bacterium]|jgi:predicted nucleic-acid-binding protein
MIRYVDTNILVRLMTNDVPALAQEAMHQVQKSKPGELIIIDAVLVELFFVLEFNKQYKFSRDKIAIIFNGILSITQFRLSDIAKEAYMLFVHNKKLDFTDCLIAVSGNTKSENVVTFDEGLLEALS